MQKIRITESQLKKISKTIGTEKYLKEHKIIRLTENQFKKLKNRLHEETITNTSDWLDNLWDVDVITEALTDRYHPVWTKEDTIIAYYIYKFGEKGIKKVTHQSLPEDGIAYLANYCIGTTVDSFKMQMENIRYLDDPVEGKLSATSRVQEEVVNEFKDKSFEEMSVIVNDIIMEIPTEEVYQKFAEIRSKVEEKLAEKDRTLQKQKRVDDLDKINKDYKKTQDKNFNVAKGMRKLTPLTPEEKEMLMNMTPEERKEFLAKRKRDNEGPEDTEELDIIQENIQRIKRLSNYNFI